MAGCAETQVVKTDPTNILARTFKSKDRRHSVAKLTMKRTAEDKQESQPSKSRQKAGEFSWLLPSKELTYGDSTDHVHANLREILARLQQVWFSLVGMIIA